MRCNVVFKNSCFDQRYANVVGDWDPRCLCFDQRHANVVGDWDLRGSRSDYGNSVKITAFQGKRIDIRITGILENPLFSTKQAIYFQNKNKWQIAPDLHKKSENVTLQETMRMFFFDCCCCWCCCWCCCCCCECCECCELMLVVWCWCFWWCCCWWWWGEREVRKARTTKREKGAKEQGRSLYTP